MLRVRLLIGVYQVCFEMKYACEQTVDPCGVLRVRRVIWDIVFTFKSIVKKMLENTPVNNIICMWEESVDPCGVLRVQACHRGLHCLLPLNQTNIF